jgi:hypothetical protein
MIRRMMQKPENAFGTSAMSLRAWSLVGNEDRRPPCRHFFLARESSAIDGFPAYRSAFGIIGIGALVYERFSNWKTLRHL